MHRNYILGISDTVDLSARVAYVSGASIRAVVDNTAGNAFWLGRSVMTTSSFREPAMQGRTGRQVTNQSESDKIISPGKTCQIRIDCSCG